MYSCMVYLIIHFDFAHIIVQILYIYIPIIRISQII